MSEKEVTEKEFTYYNDPDATTVYKCNFSDWYKDNYHKVKPITPII